MATEKYDSRTRIISETHSRDHALDTLLSLMQKEKASNLYFCGKLMKTQDSVEGRPHDYYLASNDLAVLISVMPADGEKASEPRYHPGSTEVYVVFKGSLVLELLEGDFVKEECLNQFDVKVITLGKCHRVRNDPNREASSYIVKTNPEHEPGFVGCEKCAYHKSPNICPMHKSWEAEKSLTEEK